MRFVPLLIMLLVAACGGSSGSGLPEVPVDPQLDFDLGDDGRWRSAPVADDLDDVSNNGAGYTGDIDRYELTVPADGRLVVELTWDGESDLDFILAEDPQAESRLLESTAIDFASEYESIDVIAGQVIYIFVAGWRGDATDYVLTTTVYPPEEPTFGIDELPDFEVARPANQPLRFRFNVELEPDQVLAGRVFLLDEGKVVSGAWCIDGDELAFYPQLPAAPGAQGSLVPGRSYQLSLKRAAEGLRATTGEFLLEGLTVTFPAGPAEAEDPDLIPRVLETTPTGGLETFSVGDTIMIRFNTPIDPLTLLPLLIERNTSGAERQLAFAFVIGQTEPCGEAPHVVLSIALEEPVTPGNTLRIELPGTARAVGAPPGSPGLTGPDGPRDSGFHTEFLIR